MLSVLLLHCGAAINRWLGAGWLGWAGAPGQGWAGERAERMEMFLTGGVTPFSIKWFMILAMACPIQLIIATHQVSFIILHEHMSSWANVQGIGKSFI